MKRRGLGKNGSLPGIRTARRSMQMAPASHLNPRCYEGIQLRRGKFPVAYPKAPNH